MGVDARHSLNSSLREQFIEYVFLADLCKEMWRRKVNMDVLRAHTDQSGYDLVLEVGPLVRHVQLKASYSGASTAKQNVNLQLAEKAGGCIVWIVFDADTLETTCFRWFGSRNPHDGLPPLGERRAKHTKADSSGMKGTRQNIRTLNKGEFENIPNVSALAECLFPMDAIAGNL